MKNTHIILLDGKLWAFESPEKPEFCSKFVGRTDGMGALECSFPEELTCMCGKKWFEYHSAYSLALKQRIEIENPEEVFQVLYGNKKMQPLFTEKKIKENEPIKWDGGYEECYFKKVSETWIMCMKSEYKDNEDYRKRIRLIAPVKEENSAMSYTEGSEADDPLSISGHIYRPPVPSDAVKEEIKERFKDFTPEMSARLTQPANSTHGFKPVPSEQETQEELWKEVEEILLCDSGIRSTMFELKRLFTLTRK